MVTYKKMVVVALLSCMAMSLQVHALSRCFERLTQRSLKHIPYGGALSYYLACKNRGPACEPAQAPVLPVATSETTQSSSLPNLCSSGIKPSVAECHEGDVSSSTPSVYNVDGMILEEAKELRKFLRDKYGRDVGNIVLDWLEPAPVRVVTITKDQFLGPLPDCCSDLAYGDRCPAEHILREPSVAEPIEGLYECDGYLGNKDKEHHNSIPSISMRLRFSESAYAKYSDVRSSKHAWTFQPISASSTRGIMDPAQTPNARCGVCGNMPVKAQKILNEQYARKWIGCSLSIPDSLYDLEIIGWNKQVGAGSGIEMRIYRNLPEVRLWVALVGLMKLRDDERSGKTAKAVTSRISQDSSSCSSQSSSSSSNSCTSAESAARAAKLKD